METKVVVSTESNSGEVKKENTAAAKDEAGKKKKSRCYAVICTCWPAKLKYMETAAAEQEEEDDTNVNQSFKRFIVERFDCEACKPETPRQHDKCSCSASYEYLKSLFPPFQHPTFPTTFQISSAEVDWRYERLHCQKCKDRHAEDKIKEDYYALTKPRYDGKTGWKMANEMRFKIVKDDRKEGDDGGIILKFKF